MVGKIVHYETTPAASNDGSKQKQKIRMAILPRDFDSEPTAKTPLPSNDGDHEPLGNGCYRALRHPGAP